MLSVFDPQDCSCKTPFGAVPCGTAVTFTLRDETYYACELLVRREFSGIDEAVPLPPAEGGFSGVYTAPAEPELCWYGFRFTRGDGSTVCLGKNGWCGQDALIRWHLTVYEDTPPPAWFGEGEAYQIFPDRFRRTSVPETEGMVGRRWVHQCWDEQPVVLPEENGGVVSAFLDVHTDFAIEEFTLTGIGSCPGDVTLWPQRTGTEGFYICRMRRRG